MAFEINDLRGFFILVLFAIPMVAAKNINCSGRAFHCVNSTHFMICVDLGGGLSTTIDDFVIPCPATTLCHENNVFECDFPEVTTPPLQVIGVYKQSDTSEPTSVTNSVTAPTPLREIFSVFKQNVTATTMPISEDVTPVVNFEVLENIKNPVGVNSDNTTEMSFKVTSSFIDSTNEGVNDKKIITSSATDNNHLESAAETPIHRPVNTSSTDKSKSIDTVTSVIGLINLISTELPSVVNRKSSSDVLTSLDSLYDNIATTTKQYITKQVTIHGEKAENVTEKIIIPTEIIFNEISVTTNEVSMTPVVNTYMESDINNTTEFIIKIGSGNQTIAVGNNTSELLPETTTEYLAPIKIVNISESVTVDPSPQKTTDNTFVSLGLVDLISADPKQNALRTNDYINTFYGNTGTTTTDQYTGKLETFSDKPITAEVIRTPIINTIFQNVFKDDANNDSLSELKSTVEITSMKNVSPETKINYFIPEPITKGSLQTTTENTFDPITTEANIMYTTETTPKFGDLIKNDSLVEKHTTATQPLEIIITTDSPIEPTDNLYQINREINHTMITAKNNTTSTIDTTERVETVFNASSTDIVNNHVTEPTLLLATTLKNPAIEFTTLETLQNGFTAHEIEVKNELRATSAPIIVNEPYVENVKNVTLLYNTTNTMNTTETAKTVFNASSDGKSTKPSTIKYPLIEISITENLLNEFTTHAIEAKTLSATNIPIRVNEPNTENVGNKALLNVYTTPASYNVTSDPVISAAVKDMTSQSDIATNPQTGVTPEIFAHKSSDNSTFVNQNVTTDPETKIPGSLNQPDTSEIVTFQENSKSDQWTETIFVEGVIGMTTTYWNNIENTATTQFPSEVTEKTSLSDLDKSGYQYNINTTSYKHTATDVVNTQNPLLKNIMPQAPSTVYYVSKVASTTPITVQTTPISIDRKKISEQLSSFTPEMVDIYRTSTTGYKIDNSTTLPVETHSTYIENVKDVPVTLPPQESTSREMSTVKQLNTNSTTTETVSDVVPVNIISKDNSKIDIDKTETVHPIKDKKSVNATSFVSTENPSKDESIKIVSLLDIVNSSVNAIPIGAMQPTSSIPSLSNDYIKTTESPDTSAYVTATVHVPDYNLMQVGESITQKNPEVVMEQNNVMNSILSTPSTYILPTTEINKENVHSGGIEAPLPSTVELKHIINSTKTVVDYVTEKTNYYISSTEAILTNSKLKKLPKVETESSVSPVSDFTPVTPASPGPLKIVPVYDGVTTIIDSDFIMSSTQILHKVVTDTDIKINTSLNSKVMGTQTVKYNAESTLPISEVPALQMTTEPTPIYNVFDETTPLDKMNQDVLPDLTQLMSTLNNNISQSMASLPIVGFTAAAVTTEPTHTINVFLQATPLLAAAGKTNQDIPSGINTTDFPQDVTTPVIYNNTQWVGDITTEIITDSLTVPDSMVETIEIVRDKVSGTYLGDTTLSDVMSHNPTVNNTNYNVKSVKNIDHESIVLEDTSKSNEQNTPITSAKSVDINKAEIVNHTESNWMRSDVNIDSVKIKESSIEEEDSISSVLKLGTDVRNKTLVSDASIMSKIETKDGIPADKIEHRLTKVTTNYKEAEASGTPKIVTQSKKIITTENKNAETDSTVNANIEIIDDKKIQIQVECKNISDGYNINNTKANITTTQHKLLLQNSTTNDEIEQHLLSTNHTIMTEVQSHLNESDKQSNETSDELTLNETSMHNPNTTSIKLNVGNKDTSSMNVSASDFNCSNHTRGKYADKKDCRKFYTCIGNLQSILGICPNNTVFSEINKQCTRNLSHCVINNQFRCLIEGRFSDFFKDNIYYICVQNRMNGFIRYKLQCQDDYHLNRESVKCEKNEDISTQSASVSETSNDESKPKPKSDKIVSTDDFECKNEGKFPYAKDCSKYNVCNKIENVYYICVKNRMNGFIRYKLQCQDDYHLNKDSVKCEKNEEISTQSGSSVSKSKNDENKPKSEKNVSTDDFECENEGKFPDAKDCSKYYVCTKIKNVYRRTIKQCASEEVFDKKKKMCVESDSGEC